MAIGQIEIQGQITRAHDMTHLKHNEDTKGMVEQANVSEQFSKVIENQLTIVYRGERPEYQNKKFDAKEKGSNEYGGDGGRKGRKKEKEKRDADGKVLLKSIGNFDASM